MKERVTDVANMLTACRILCGIAMLFFPAFSVPFYVLYLAAGFTDMIDGTVARRLKQDSEFGAKLDTAADMVFTAAAAVKVLPNICMPLILWLWAALIAALKVISIIIGFVLRKRFVTVHSALNRVTGCMLFIMPLAMRFIGHGIIACAVCLIATAAALQECYLIGKRENGIQTGNGK